MDAKKVGKNAIKLFNRRITDEIFLTIQRDRNLMREYLEAVRKQGAETVNQEIGKIVKAAYKLTDSKEREENPSCTLISSHQIFE